MTSAGLAFGVVLPSPIELRVVLPKGAAAGTPVLVFGCAVGPVRLFLALERERLVAWRLSPPATPAYPVIAGRFRIL